MVGVRCQKSRGDFVTYINPIFDRANVCPAVLRLSRFAFLVCVDHGAAAAKLALLRSFLVDIIAAGTNKTQRTR